MLSVWPRHRRHLLRVDPDPDQDYLYIGRSRLSPDYRCSVLQIQIKTVSRSRSRLSQDRDLGDPQGGGFRCDDFYHRRHRHLRQCYRRRSSQEKTAKGGFSSGQSRSVPSFPPSIVFPPNLHAGRGGKGRRGWNGSGESVGRRAAHEALLPDGGQDGRLGETRRK